MSAPSLTPHAGLTHVGADGQAHMVDVSDKAETVRVAVAEGYVRMRPETLDLILKGNAKKGDVIATARLAGMMAAKQTANLIPLCHPLMLSKVSVDISADETLPGLRIEAMAKLTGRTGVEMEALTAASIACLTIYDMAKAADREMEIGGILLVQKSVGSSGDYIRQESEG